MGCGCGENAPDTVANGMSVFGKPENDAGIGVCSVLGREGCGAAVGKRGGELGAPGDH